MYLPNELRDEHCKHVLQRFETVVDRFRKTATRTAIGTLAFFVIFFIPFIKLGYTKTKLSKSHAAIHLELESRKQAFRSTIEKLEVKEQSLRNSEQMLARVSACSRAEEALEQMRRDVERDFTFPLEVPALNSLPAELTTAVPIAAAPWRVDWATKRHVDLSAHYRVMLAILTRISVHQATLEDRIFAPVLAELDPAGRLRTREQAAEIRKTLVQLQRLVRGKFEAPLEQQTTDNTTDPGKPRNFGLWVSYAFDPSQADQKFTAVLSESFRDSLRTEAANVTTQIEQLVSDAPWKGSLDDAWSKLGLDQEILQKIKSVDLSDKELRAVLEPLNLGDSTEVVSEELQSLETSGADLLELGSKWLKIFASDGSAEPKPDESMDRPTPVKVDTIIKADIVRQKEKTLPIELEKVQADIAAAELKAKETVHRDEERLKQEWDALHQGWGSAGKFLGGLPVRLEDAILLFPVLLAGGFLICCAQFREAARLRDTYGELTRDDSTATCDVDLTSVLPFPLADANSRQLRWIAIGVPFIFQVVALGLLLKFNHGDIAPNAAGSLGTNPVPAASVSPDAPPKDSVASDDPAHAVEDPVDRIPPAVSNVAAGESQDPSPPELDSSDTYWLYLIAFLVSTLGMIWGTVYAAGSFPQQANERRQKKTSKTAATADSAPSN